MGSQEMPESYIKGCKVEVRIMEDNGQVRVRLAV